MALTDIYEYILTAGRCEYVALHGKTDFVDVINIKDFEMEKLSWWVYSNHIL